MSNLILKYLSFISSIELKKNLSIFSFAQLHNPTKAEVIIRQSVIIVGFRLQNGREAISGK
ncbi:hypothetical protein E2605_08630 [Dysgonomonas capnocytophagoides]|uniref:Uncharacterized protein n=1 Tax=Dysgonomonas capnocytophagoides TaxID=45254 RepID=A0A4Y8L2J2_9BACT|nr:hypothetical protein [Dysgonomonas capnocytophagoides]TFD96869.1 hypothetical protein E2605_08630 [Dysgonomonas capnocytophagoides]